MVSTLNQIIYKFNICLMTNQKINKNKITFSHILSPHKYINLLHFHTPTLSLSTQTHTESTADLFVAAELRGVEQRAVIEQFRNQLRAAHPGITVWKGKHCSQRSNHKHLDDRVVTETSGFTL